MPYEIIIIKSSMANCYLLKTGAGLVLIDTGISYSRGVLNKALKKAGCRPGDLKLVLMTHADWDHSGNAAWLRKKYGAPLAIHRDEAGAVESGQMLLNRKSRQRMAFRMLLALSRPLCFRRFRPDVLLTDGDDLSRYGLEGRVIHVPGHSRGSIGVLTAEGDFFCGDLLTNSGGPRKNDFVDDSVEMDASVEKLKSLNIKTVYPGHGRPFTMEEFTRG